MPILIGQPLQEQEPAIIYDRLNGITYERVWIGAKGDSRRKASELQLIPVHSQRPDSVIYRPDGEKATVVARYGGLPGQADQPQETQELDTEAITQSILVHKSFVGLAESIKREIRRVHDNPPAADDSETTYEKAVDKITAAVAKVPGTDLQLALDAYDLLSMGTETFEIHVFSLTRTRTVSQRYTTKISLSDLGKIFTTAQLAAITGNPILFDVPSLEVTADETAKGLTPGWRKKVARVQDVANGSRQMIEVWQLAKWSTKRNLYELKA